MNIEDMTPEQLREYATAKEMQRETITAHYMNRSAGEAIDPKPQLTNLGGFATVEVKHPYEHDVEFEGETYRVDMRRIKSREFIRMFAEFQDYERKGEDAPISCALALYDFVFGGKVDDKVCEVVKAKMGYEDFEEIMRIENELFEHLEVKN